MKTNWGGVGKYLHTGRAVPRLQIFVACTYIHTYGIFLPKRKKTAPLWIDRSMKEKCNRNPKSPFFLVFLVFLFSFFFGISHSSFPTSHHITKLLESLYFCLGVRFLKCCSLVFSSLILEKTFFYKKHDFFGITYVPMYVLIKPDQFPSPPPLPGLSLPCNISKRTALRFFSEQLSVFFSLLFFSFGRCNYLYKYLYNTIHVLYNQKFKVQILRL